MFVASPNNKAVRPLRLAALGVRTSRLLTSKLRAALETRRSQTCRLSGKGKKPIWLVINWINGFLMGF